MRSNDFAYPKPGLLGSLLSAAANSRMLGSVRRAIFSRLPFVRLESDVSDIVYLNWVIPSRVAGEEVPPGVRILDVGGATILTVLTYRHGGFGPSLLGPLRRLYLAEVPPGATAGNTVLFLKNIFDSAIYAVGTRVFSDALPSHKALEFTHRKQGDRYVTSITAGMGSAPELSCVAAKSVSKELPTEFQRFFASWEQAVEYLCLQDAAICAVPGANRIAQAGIELPIDTSRVIPLAPVNYVPGVYLRRLQAEGAPFCFVVPSVKFKVLWERLLPDLPAHDAAMALSGQIVEGERTMPRRSGERIT